MGEIYRRSQPIGGVVLAINLWKLEDYKEYLSDLGWSDERIEDEAEYRFTDVQGEQIKYRIRPDGSWQWQELCDTGGYWEPIEDLDKHLKWYFRYNKETGADFRCVCHDAQFLTLKLVKNPEGSEYKYRHETDDDCVCCHYNKILAEATS